ncbi:hypothetical protein VFPPC_16189 [Pochonia chlamydosporia 170]|uniref:Uncharacterized protein n=1 Tax=Pochonia chlamydosporia 170 TaxID=1380566 RepID=A0A179FG95_METCM|nr:hypothetical protein VFPPC_16189 [Pochonia chlamydosporia 170]OAQ64271.1 hypothetical protein VFPPC_16189 [Pochonia chlamydosporia 170]
MAPRVHNFSNLLVSPLPLSAIASFVGPRQGPGPSQGPCLFPPPIWRVLRAIFFNLLFKYCALEQFLEERR